VRYGFLLILLISLPCWTQTTTTGQATANAPCSVANTGNGNNIQINCGVGKEQGQKIIALLNKALAKGVNADAVLTQILLKEDEIISNQEKQSEEISKIKGQQGPWVLDSSTKQQMFDLLKNMPGVPVVIDEWAESSRRFSKGLIDLFLALNAVDGKWQVAQRGGMSFDAPPIGLGCVGPEGLSPSMAKIETALQLISPNIHCIPLPPSRLDIHDRESVRIWVGERP
jgi:hypothetical protein